LSIRKILFELVASADLRDHFAVDGDSDIGQQTGVPHLGPATRARRSLHGDNL